MLMVSVTVEFIYINYVTTITYVTVCVWCTLWLKWSKMVSKRSVCFCYGLFFGSSPSSKSFLIESWPGWSCRLRIAFLRVRASHELTSQCTCHLLLVLLYCTLFPTKRPLWFSNAWRNVCYRFLFTYARLGDDDVIHIQQIHSLCNTKEITFIYSTIVRLLY